MGVENRQRRAAKQRRRRESERTRGPRPENIGDGELLAALVWEAARARCDGHPDASELLDVLHRAPHALAFAALGDATRQVRAAVLRHGWSDDDLAAVEARRLRLSGGATDIERALARLALLMSLPPLPTVDVREPPPAATDGMLAKIRALLAKAESTEFAGEADALTAKAQQLMARHRIDHAAIQDVGDHPSGRRIWLDDPYADAKANLLATVAAANRCRAIQLPGVGCVHVVGFASDLDIVELLHASLLVQATSAMALAGSQIDRYGRSRTRSFRSSFLTAFAARIGTRLREANAAGEAEGLAAHATDLLPVLARRDDDVEAAVAALFPTTTRRSIPITNEAGWIAGTMAADQADLSVGDPLTSGP